MGLAVTVKLPNRGGRHMIRKLILIRHGMTAGNRKKRYISMTDEEAVSHRAG